MIIRFIKDTELNVLMFDGLMPCQVYEGEEFEIHTYYLHRGVIQFTLVEPLKGIHTWKALISQVEVLDEDDKPIFLNDYRINTGDIKHVQQLKEYFERPVSRDRVFEIGYGHRAHWVGSHSRIDEQEALFLLAQDVSNYADLVCTHARVPLAPSQIQALIYLMAVKGPGAVINSPLMRSINAKDMRAALQDLVEFCRKERIEFTVVTLFSEGMDQGVLEC